MEEIDNIIIESLKQLHCNFDEDVVSLKQFDADMIVNAVACCLETINPGTYLPHKLPTNMSLRLKLATNLAEQIQELGFRGDMSYQTILYCNEIEIRRVLMFLIERLPRESSKIVVTEETGYVPRLVKEIEERVKLHLEKPWVPSVFLLRGARPCENTYLRHSYGDSSALHSANLYIPNTTQEVTEDYKQYWVHSLPDVTKQCKQRELIPSLLFKDTEFTDEHLNVVLNETVTEIPVVDETITTQVLSAIEKNEDKQPQFDNLKTEVPDVIQQIQTKNEELYKKFVTLQEDLKKTETKLMQLDNSEIKEKEVLSETCAKINIKSKTLTVLAKDENLTKLKNIVENGSMRLVDLANQWNDMQTPLLEQYRQLQSNLLTQESKIQQEQEKLQSLKETKNQLLNDLSEKEKVEAHLIKKCEKLSNSASRSAYTHRILEIIGNIRKQNNDITKILKDANEVQKDINMLNGRIERSFTLSDELIFRDAKQDEMARKAYKLLVALHNECGEVIKGVTDLGLAERESRNLQEQVDAESAKDIPSKLKHVTADLEQVRNETSQLLKNL